MDLKVKKEEEWSMKEAFLISLNYSGDEQTWGYQLQKYLTPNNKRAKPISCDGTRNLEPHEIFELANAEKIIITGHGHRLSMSLSNSLGENVASMEDIVDLLRTIHAEHGKNHFKISLVACSGLNAGRLLITRMHKAGLYGELTARQSTVWAGDFGGPKSYYNPWTLGSSFFHEPKNYDHKRLLKSTKDGIFEYELDASKVDDAGKPILYDAGNPCYNLLREIAPNQFYQAEEKIASVIDLDIGIDMSSFPTLIEDIFSLGRLSVEENTNDVIPVTIGWSHVYNASFNFIWEAFTQKEITFEQATQNTAQLIGFMLQVLDMDYEPLVKIVDELQKIDASPEKSIQAFNQLRFMIMGYARRDPDREDFAASFVHVHLSKIKEGYDQIIQENEETSGIKLN